MNHQKQIILSHKVETINMFIRNSGLLNLKSVVVDEGASSLDLPMTFGVNWPHLTVTIFLMILSKKYETVFAH